MPEQLKPELRFPEFDGDWNTKSLGNPDVAAFFKGKGISKNDIVEDGATPCIRYGELYTEYNEVIDEVKSSTNVPVDELVLSEEFDVIIPASGETVIDIATASCVLKSDIALGGDLNIIRPNTLNGLFLAYYLNNAKKRNIARLAQGISVIHLYKNHLKSLNLNIPEPDEQQKIANFLKAIDKRIKLLKAKKEALEDYKTSIMQKLFAQEIRFKQDDGSDFPEWGNEPLSKVADIITGKTPPTKDKELWDGNILFITPTDIDDEVKYQFSTSRTVVKRENLKLLPKSSIVYTCIASIGKIAITTKPSITNQQINSLVLKDEMDSEFVYYALKQITPWIKSLQATTTLPIINKTEFSKFVIPKPELSEQKKIGYFLKGIDSKIESLQSKAFTIEIFKKSLMQKMFV